MKRISLILAAMALVLGLSQCKKEEQSAPSATGGTVAITLDVSSPAGSRIDVNTASGEVRFEQGDTVHVAYGGQHVGHLTYQGSTFKGNLSLPSTATGGNLHFYFLGNKATTVNGTTCTVDISDQAGKLPVISYAASNESYTGPGLYTAKFLNKAALVEFDLQGARMRSSHTLWLTGLGNKVTVDFTQPAGNDNGFSFGRVDNEGLVKTNVVDATATKVYAIVPPASNGLTGTAAVMKGQAQVGTDTYPFTIEAFAANDYKRVTVTGVNIPTPSYTAPTGAVSNHVFTVSGGLDAKEVFFSQGNLQYQASNGIWRFAESQLDYVGDASLGNVYENGVKSNNRLASETYDGWIDLFGWGTSGHHNVNDQYCDYYAPWSTSNTAYPNDTLRNYWHYGPSVGFGDGSLTGVNAIYDWGYNAISNGGNQGGQWRTLTREEWVYLLTTRAASTVCGTANARYAKATVGGVKGVIVFPDEYEHPDNVMAVRNINQPTAGYSSNDYNVSAFGDMQAKGAVFLPAAGYRSGTSVGHVCNNGYYWSASPYGSAIACNALFSDGTLRAGNYSSGRSLGSCVRLVQDAQ